jgi:hypothetical protein
VERTGSQYSCVVDFFNDCYELLVAIALQFLIILIAVNSKRLLPCSQLVWAVSMIHQLSAWIIHMCNVKKNNGASWLGIRNYGTTIVGAENPHNV